MGSHQPTYHFPESVKWESGMAWEKGKSQQTRRSVGLSLVIIYPAALTPKPMWGIRCFPVPRGG
ncbi:MAG: hypothetical protein K0T01_2797 [Acidimicrobiia bacterium]|jgi:hypothetical protein|nr:hypothetical protein [Acidimicrobiia bacterium]